MVCKIVCVCRFCVYVYTYIYIDNFSVLECIRSKWFLYVFCVSLFKEKIIKYRIFVVTSM